VDRVFTVEGFGTVVTGTLWRGAIRTGDVLELLPAGHTVRVRRVQVHGATVDEALAGQRTAVALHGVAKEQVTRGDWLVAPASLAASEVLDVRFELLPDYPREWRAATRVRFHIGASEIIGRLVLLEGRALRAGESALAQLRLDRPAVAARGDRFVIRSYSPSRTVGGGSVIEPVASRRRRRASLDALTVHESGDLEARIVEKLAGAAAPVTTPALARALAEPEPAVAGGLERLLAAARVARAGEGRWVGIERWNGARQAIERAVGEYIAKYPARYGVPKGELKSAQRALDPALFDAAFESLVAAGTLAMRGERVREARSPWAPPAETMAALERLEAEFEAGGFQVPENAAWQAKLGRAGAEVMALGLFLERLVRVSQELTYTARQMERLRALLAGHFAKQPALGVGDLRALTGASRKFGVPLLEHSDRVGWTMRIGDERRAGAKLGDAITKPL
jgi:selenocysteine-specific elongation factor